MEYEVYVALEAARNKLFDEWDCEAIQLDGLYSHYKVSLEDEIAKHEKTISEIRIKISEVEKAMSEIEQGIQRVA